MGNSDISTCFPHRSQCTKTLYAEWCFLPSVSGGRYDIQNPHKTRLEVTSREFSWAHYFLRCPFIIWFETLHRVFEWYCCHYNDVLMSELASQITSVSIVCSTIHSAADQRKHQSSASLAFVQGIHRWPVNSPHKRPVTRKMFPFDYVITVFCQNDWTTETEYVMYHYTDVIMSTMASQITSVSNDCSTVCSGADRRTHQSSASLAFVQGIRRWPVNSPHKGSVTRKCFHLMTSSCTNGVLLHLSDVMTRPFINFKYGFVIKLRHEWVIAGQTFKGMITIHPCGIL